MKKLILTFLLAITSSAHANSIRDWFEINNVSIFGGISKYNKTYDGIYWNVDQKNDWQLNPPVFGARYDGDGWAAQYTHFGTVTVDAWAVTTDAPYAGGYIQGGGCVGPCAPLAQWHMSSETQSIAVMNVRKIGNWSFELGANFFEIRTKGYVNNYPNGSVFRYKEQVWLDVGPMAGIGYRVSNNLTVRAQVWRMEGRGDPNDGYKPPAAFREDWQGTFNAGWSFK